MEALSIFSSLLASVVRAGADLPKDLRDPGVFSLLALSIQEDLFADLGQKAESHSLEDLLKSADITSRATLPYDQQLHTRIVAKQDGVLAGVPICGVIFRILDPKIQIKTYQVDGAGVFKGEIVMEIFGRGRALLAAERTALNFLGSLSGTATLVNRFVKAVHGTNAQILDTRKTTPGHRKLQKYAVRMGGGMNHRMGLYDMVLIKNNHIDGAGGIQQAVARVRESYGVRYPIVVEVRTLDELRTALELNLTRILLDNMNPDQMSQAVQITNKSTPLEASGSVSLQNVRTIAETGVDYISIGALTHSAPNFDLSMHLLEQY